MSDVSINYKGEEIASMSEAGTKTLETEGKYCEDNIEVVYSGGLDTSDATATAGDILSGKTAYVKGSKVTGTIATKTSSNLTASGATVTVPAGYYASQATKSVATGSATAPSSISGTSATVSTGTNTLTLSKAVSVTPSVSAGYVSSGTAGNSSVSLSASVTTKAAATITPTTSNQTIAAGTYLTGAQTIKGDTNLVAGNIKSGVSIFGVNGSHQGGTDTSDATAAASDILSGKTAYVNGSKITGTIATKTSSNLTKSGLTVTAPAGYYASAASTSVSDSNLLAENIRYRKSIFGVTGTYNQASYTTGSNLMSLKEQDITVAGVRFITHADGTMEASGTATSSTWAGTGHYKNISLAAGTYTFIAVALESSAKLYIATSFNIESISDMPTGAKNIVLNQGGRGPIHKRVFTLNSATSTFCLQWRTTVNQTCSGTIKFILIKDEF